MSLSRPSGPTTGPELESLVRDETDIDLEELYGVLANRRRRLAIHELQRCEETVELGDLSEQLAAWEEDKTPREVTAAERKAMYTALQQRHLPRMDRARLVRFDDRAATVAPTDQLLDLDVYTEVVGDRDFPWSQYYLGLSALGCLLLLGCAAAVPPLGRVPPLAPAVFTLTAFAVSSVVHLYATREMKLGESERPPELPELPD